MMLIYPPKKTPPRKSSQILLHLFSFRRCSKFFFSYMESGPGGMFWAKERHRAPPGTPRKSGFSARKSPKEGERVARRHFHERVGESPRSYENFGTSGSKIRRFVSEIWPFEVGIGVRAD